MPDDIRMPHYIRANEQSRVPRKHIILDAGERIRTTPWGSERAWRGAVARFWSQRKGRPRAETRGVYREPLDLWTAVSDHCGGRDRTVLWAHNLGYDARITDAFSALPALGWEIEAHNLAPRGTWMVWRKGQANLTMVDTASIWPTTLADIGRMFGLGVARIPDGTPADEAWTIRSESHVDIVATAVSAYLDWLDQGKAGNWQITGASQSWAAFRHSHLTHRMLVHDDQDALAAERVAMWTGRCEAYWHGTLRREVIHEWDLSTAYPRVARDISVPTQLVGPMPRTYDWAHWIPSAERRLLAQCSVRTASPVAPTRHQGRIIWPCGDYTTTLWDVEIAALLQAGATVTVHKGWIYKAAPALKSWAEWILRQVAAPDDVVPAWLKAIARHHGRALIGRFGMTYRLWHDFGALAEAGVDRRTCVDTDTDETYDIMQIGHKVSVESGLSEWSQSMPSITGYVMAATRMRLWRIMQALPQEAVLYVDTDSVLTHDSHYATVEALTRTPIGEGLRLKGSWDGVQIMGPRKIITGDRVRISGLPLRATRTDGNEWSGDVWESAAQAMAHGRSDTVRTMARTWRIAPGDHRRIGHGVGWTTPITLGG